MSTATENRARRAAKSAGLIARKSRRYDPINNQGEFMLVEPERNFPVAGFHYDMSAEEVIDYCKS